MKKIFTIIALSLFTVSFVAPTMTQAQQSTVATNKTDKEIFSKLVSKYTTAKTDAQRAETLKQLQTKMGDQAKLMKVKSTENGNYTEQDVANSYNIMNNIITAQRGNDVKTIIKELNNYIQFFK